MQRDSCFGHLTIEENLLTGAFTRRDGKAAIRCDLDMVYSYFPRLAERRDALSGYTSGGEQQMWRARARADVTPENGLA